MDVINLLKLKEMLKHRDNRVLFSNFLALSALQAANYIFPLITFPYLVRVLGVELFGVLAMATAVINYFQIITDYGFELSATKEISVHRDDKSRIIEIFSSVMIIKFILLLFSFLLLSILVLSFEKFSQNLEVYYFTFGMVVGQSLFPIWFFQGMEKMKYITVLTVIAKLIFTLSIFLFVRDQSDFFLVPLLNSIGSITAGIIALYVIKRDFGVSFLWQKIATIKFYFQHGWDIFVQRFYVNLYSGTNILILGFLTNDTVVGYYAIAGKIIEIFNQFFEVVANVYYPYFAKKFSTQPKQSLYDLKKISLILLLISVSAMIFVMLFDDFIVTIVAGEHYSEHITNVLGILAYAIILFPFFSLFTNVLVAISHSKELMIIARDTALISIIMAPILITLLQEEGLAYLMVALWIMIIFRYTKVIYKVSRSTIQEKIK
jgi:PST family polysaccharide transporter